MSERAGSRSQENGRGCREAGEGMSAGSGSSAGSGGESDSSASGNEGSAHSFVGASLWEEAEENLLRGGLQEAVWLFPREGGPPAEEWKRAEKRFLEGGLLEREEQVRAKERRVSKRGYRLGGQFSVRDPSTQVERERVDVDSEAWVGSGGKVGGRSDPVLTQRQWKALTRQLIIEGLAAKVRTEETEERASRIRDEEEEWEREVAVQRQRDEEELADREEAVRVEEEIVDQTERKLAVVQAAQEGLIPPSHSEAPPDSEEEEEEEEEERVYRNLMDLALLRVCRTANEEL